MALGIQGASHVRATSVLYSAPVQREAAQRPQVLIAFRDPGGQKELLDMLAANGFATLLARDAFACLALTSSEKPDLILLETALPAASGFAICRLLRDVSRTPIILLSSSFSEIDRIFALELGANVCMEMPYAASDILAHIQFLLMDKGRERIALGRLTLYPQTLELVREGETITISRDQMRLLTFLGKHLGEFCPLEMVHAYLWGDNSTCYSKLPMLMKRLRRRLEPDPKHPRYLITSWAFGYKLDA